MSGMKGAGKWLSRRYEGNEETQMRRSFPLWLFLAGLLLMLPALPSFGQTTGHEEALSDFWGGISEKWLPTGDDYWTEGQRKAVLRYCKNFAGRSDPKPLVPAMVRDLARNPSEVNAFIYTWVVMNWKREEVDAALAPFSKSNDPDERQIASDFVAEMEEAAKPDNDYSRITGGK